LDSKWFAQTNRYKIDQIQSIKGRERYEKNERIYVGWVCFSLCVPEKKDGGNEGLPVAESFNPVGSWFLEAKPATFNDTSCGGNIFGVYSDTVTVSLNGNQATMHSFGIDYKGTYSNNTLKVTSTDFDPSDDSTLTDTFELGLKSDRQATGVETWNVRGGQECSGTHSLTATKSQ
jgi:hypothetical protein